jgi:hypothetical protein
VGNHLFFEPFLFIAGSLGAYSPLLALSTPTPCQGAPVPPLFYLYLDPKNIFLPPLFPKMIFSPSRDTSLFDSQHVLFVSTLPCFAIILPLKFPLTLFFSLSFFFSYISPLFLSLFM